jgi:1,4-dihydroxy-2-naphthoate octaprenyltransferase
MILKHYIDSFRLRTLPLSVAGIMLGSFYATAAGCYHPVVFVLALLTTLSLQILSNISNEVGDLEKGTDNEQRLGPIRSVQRGDLTVQNLKNAMMLFIILSVLSGICLVWSAFGTLISLPSVTMLVMGALAIVASIKYTFGKKAYGYVGLGDFFVFVFFGLVSTMGVYFIATGELPLSLILPASAIGMLSTGVLNVNNMRDIENDTEFKKRTMAVRMGAKKIKMYHLFLVIGALVLTTVYTVIQNSGMYGYLFLLTIPVFSLHLSKVMKNNGRALDSQLKVLSLCTLLFSFFAGLGSLLNS